MPASSVLACALLCAGVSARAGDIELKLVAQLPVGRSPEGLALSPNRKTVYSANVGSDTVSAVDVRARRVKETYPVCHHPWVLRAGAAQVFAGCNDGVSVVDLATRKVQRIDCGRIWDLLLNKDGRRLYITSQQHGIYVLDTQTLQLTLLSRVLIPIGLALTPDEKFLYVSYQGGGPGGTSGHDAIAQLDASSGRLIRSITGLANVGLFLSMSADGRRLWASGADACWSIQYDHVGCPAVPAGVLHIFDLPEAKNVTSLAWVSRSTVYRMVFSPSEKWVLANGHDPVLYWQENKRAAASLRGVYTQDAVFPENDNGAVVSLTELDRIGFVEIQTKARAR